MTMRKLKRELQRRERKGCEDVERKCRILHPVVTMIHKMSASTLPSGFNMNVCERKARKNAVDFSYFLFVAGRQTQGRQFRKTNFIVMLFQKFKQVSNIRGSCNYFHLYQFLD